MKIEKDELIVQASRYASGDFLKTQALTPINRRLLIAVAEIFTASVVYVIRDHDTNAVYTVMVR